MSEQFVIRGGNRLKGKTTIRGSKNAATKMMVAALLTNEPCVIQNIPLISDIEITGELCARVGAEVQIDKSAHTCNIHAHEITAPRVPKLSKRNRIPILALGPLLHRRGVAEVPVLGGCPIGHRPITMHLAALQDMGIHIERRDHSYYAESSEIHGADINLEYPSVGATENIIFTAVLAKGRTTIQNAAVEPEIQNTIKMLRDMGAVIDIDIEKRFINIDGVNNLHGVKTTVMPDRNEIVSFAVAALATDGDIFVENISPWYLKTFLSSVEAIGGEYHIQPGGIQFKGTRPYKNTHIRTAPYPGFMTDWEQPFSVLLTQAEGDSILHETVYEERLGHLEDLKNMGAHIVISNACLDETPCRFHEQAYLHSARITGPTPLHGTDISVPDLRAGIAHIIAALTAIGESTLSGIEHIERGYEYIDERLRILGADIKRVTT